MAAEEAHDPIPVFRSKRRKTEHKRTRLDDHDGNATNTSARSPVAATEINAPSTLPVFPALDSPATDADESVPNLKEIIRMRKRPQQRMKNVGNKVAATSSQDAVVLSAAPHSDQYAGRFVAQTGQIVDKDDTQMMAYIEARMAEQNFQKYGWPIPKHIQGRTSPYTTTPERPNAATTPTTMSPSSKPQTGEATMGKNTEHEGRLAAGMGKLEEVDLGPSAAQKNLQRTEEAWRRLHGENIARAEEEVLAQERKGKGKKFRRHERRRNSEDLRRDAMVEAVLREAKLGIYEEEEAPTPPAADDQAADDVLMEQFRREYLESMESRNQRKPAIPPGPKGALEQPKGPKLGGSRSARAAMRLREEQAAKNKR
ncbi:hypothetical protein CC78DRAFT_303805 [Lojkania enalia]|uniref:Hepatocellular carcinoma-associated antigen 59-domain-containing protein n=1 Tax=Lojkania enalia TaxID=147567 RepID=A0A9P4TPJ2_9PLEO|nr:hypothetical protein CC78DRAFT_303805 [Didymosphaeria enalia]